MERLGVSDLEGALRFVREAAAETGPEPFPAHVLEGLRELVGYEWASYCELDRRHRRELVLIKCPSVAPQFPDGENPFWRVVDQHPLCRAQKHGRFDALKLSDFHSRRELHRREVYADMFRPLGSSMSSRWQSRRRWSTPRPSSSMTSDGTSASASGRC